MPKRVVEPALGRLFEYAEPSRVAQPQGRAAVEVHDEALKANAYLGGARAAQAKRQAKPQAHVDARA